LQCIDIFPPATPERRAVPARKTLALGRRGVPGFCGRWIDYAAAATLVAVAGTAALPVDRAGQPAVAAVVSGR
jgi:hypothetical protein